MIPNRKYCVVCSNEQFEHLYTFEKFPIYMGISHNHNVGDDLHEDMIWQICKTCGCIQLKNLIEQEILYKTPHNPSIGQTWEKHHLDFADFVLKNCGKDILEIGGGNLKLQNNIISNEKISSYTVIDKHQYEEKTNRKQYFINGIFEPYSLLNSEYDTIIHSHTFEHFYEPQQYIKKFYDILNPGDKMIFSLPNIQTILFNGMNNGINFEHTFLATKDNISFMLENNGFEIIEIKEYTPFNLFFYCKKSKNFNKKSVVVNEYEKNKNIFVSLLENNKKMILELIPKLEKNNSFIFGAHINSQYLFQFGLEEEYFKLILDNDPSKIGHRLYGTSLYVESPKTLKDYDSPVIVLKNGIYNKEIQEQILSINSNSKVLV